MSGAGAGAEPPRAGGSRRLLFLAPVALFAGLAALFANRLHSGDPARVPSALIGRPAPTVDLPALDGLTGAAGSPLSGLSRAALAQGRVSVVNVWASWCAPCRIEHPLLAELAREPDVALVGINYKDAPANALRFLGSLGNPYEAVGVDANGRAAIEWGVYGVPETFLVGPDGTILHKQVGPLTAEALPEFLARVRAARRAGG